MHRGQRYHNGVVLVTHPGLSLGRQYPDHLKGRGPYPQLPPDGVIGAEQFIAHGIADHGYGCSPAGLILREEASIRQRPLVYGKVVDRGAGDGRVACLLQIYRAQHVAAQRRDSRDTGNLLRDGDDVRLGEIGYSRGRRAGAEARAGAQHYQVAPQVFDLRLDGHCGALAKSHHGDHGGDTDDDAQHRQERAAQVAPDFAQSDEEGICQHTPDPLETSVTGAVSFDEAVHNVDGPPGVCRDVVLMRHHQNGDAPLAVQVCQ